MSNSGSFLSEYSDASKQAGFCPQDKQFCEGEVFWSVVSLRSGNEIFDLHKETVQYAGVPRHQVMNLQGEGPICG